MHDPVEQAPPDVATEDEAEQHQRFSSNGELPAVGSDEAVLKPSASDVAYADADRAPAPPTPSPTTNTPAASDTWPQLLNDFDVKFPAAAKLIGASPPACRFVKECEAGGAKFGGYAEDGYGGSAWPYTINDTVYVPKAHTEPIQAMSDFLFELNNAVRSPRFKALRKEARKGSKGSVDAKTYARKTVELEVEGMLKLGEVWFEMKKSAGKQTDKTWSAYDKHFYLKHYQDHKAGKITVDDIVNGVLQSKYTEGADAGKTVEEFYMKQYEAHAQFAQ